MSHERLVAALFVSILLAIVLTGVLPVIVFGSERMDDLLRCGLVGCS